MKNFLADARHFQLVFLSFFLLIVSLETDSLYTYTPQIAICVAVSLITQYVAILILKLPYSTLKSALITSFGLSLLLKTDTLWIMGLAAFLAISSKFIIRYNNKHIFNPANFGVIVAILLTGNAYISPGQWGSDVILLFIVGSLGFLVIHKVNRWDIAVCFLFSYAFLLFARDYIYLSWPIDKWLHSIWNGTLMLFTFFMITDPMTTPNHRKGRIIFALLLASISFYLGSFEHIYTAPLWVLFCLSPITPIFDRIWEKTKYHWKSDSSTSF